MDTLSRKMFQNSEARRKLSQMAGIRGAFPELAQVAARYQDGGPVRPSVRALMGLPRDQLEEMGLPISELAREWEQSQRPSDRVPVLMPEDLAAIQRAQAGFPSVDPPPEEERLRDQFSAGLEQEQEAERRRVFAERYRNMADVAANRGEPERADEFLRQAEDLEVSAGEFGARASDILRQAEEVDAELFPPPQEDLRPATDQAVAEALRDEPPAGAGQQTDTTPAGGGPAGGAGAGERRDTDPPTADESEIDRILRDQFGIDPPSRDPRSRREQMEQRLDLIREVLGEPNRDRARDRAMHLAMIGLAIAAGQSPSALANIAQGALAGTQAMARAQQAESDRENELRMLAYRDLLGEEQDERALRRDVAMARYRASLGGGANPAQGAIDRMYSDTYNNTYRTLLEQNIPPDEASAQAREVAGSQFPEATIVTQRRMAEVAAQVQQDLRNNVPVAQIRAQVLELGLNPDAFEGLSE